MLYLMMCQGKDKNMVKVGYTAERSCTTRRKNYATHNPLAIMRSHSRGNAEAEKEARKILTEKGGERITGSEWFSVSAELYDTLYREGMGYFFPKLAKNLIHFDEV